MTLSPGKYDEETLRQGEEGSADAQRLLADKGEPIGFASRDGDQAGVAAALGFAAV